VSASTGSEFASLQFSFGFHRARLVYSFAAVVLILMGAFWLIADAVRRLARPPFVEDRDLFVLSIIFVAADVFQIFQLAVLGLRQPTFKQIEPCSIFLFLLASFTAVISAVLIDSFEIYFVDGISELMIAVSMADFAWSFLSEQIDKLLLGVSNDELNGIAIILGKIGKVKNLRMWKPSEKLTVATVTIDRNWGDATDREIRQMKGWEVTIEVSA
jgi:Co/Zn/Cd efflux system component